jgi:hypothetical protein
MENDMSNAHLTVASDFKRTDPRTLGGHPLRGSLTEKIQREQQLRRDDNEPRRGKLAVIRDTVISVMGAVSAFIPLMIAFQSVTGA